MSNGRILYTIVDGVCLIRLEGRVTHTLGLGFGSFIDKLFEAGTVDDVVVDLRQTTFIDSTALGLLGKLANGVRSRLDRKVTLVSTDADINLLLTNIGFDDVFIMVRDLTRIEEDLREIPRVEPDQRDRAKVVLEAHRTLMDMNEENRACFRDVVELLEGE
jgi:anti-anti-sigma factor